MKELLTEPFLHSDNGFPKINTKEISDLLLLRPEQLFQPHRVSFYAIHLLCEGFGKHSIDFDSIDIKEKHILFISPGQIAQFHHPTDYKGRVLIFTEDFFCRNNAQTQFLGHTCLFNDPLKLSYFSVDDRFEEILNLFDGIHKELQRPFSEIKSSIINNYLFNILLIAEELYQPMETILDTHPYKILVSKFKSIANKDLSCQYSIQYFADQLNVSIRTLEKAFVEVEKITPKKWLIERIILEIKRNLVYNEITISEIAYNLGFKEVTNFTKFFKAKTGQTPSRFRENMH
ncbi:helix-turn-helix domain-containing protein [Chryseobacterium sp. Alg-005]|uniref:helix-turn-helix domain-containing protein n=1 Tax=Chryseobacterium sp. Alg-005 TaxID=3159516 RepID=UPI0035557956